MSPTLSDILGVSIVAVCFALACLVMPADSAEHYISCEAVPYVCGGEP